MAVMGGQVYSIATTFNDIVSAVAHLINSRVIQSDKYCLAWLKLEGVAHPRPIYSHLTTEIAVLTNIRRTATIQAKSYCNIYSLEQHDLFEVLKNYPAIKSKLMNVAGERLRVLSKKRVLDDCTHLFPDETA